MNETLAIFIADQYGERCAEYEPHCIVCESWQLYDRFVEWIATEGGA